MNIIWGIIVIVISVIAWLGQTIAALSPTTAEKLGVTESEADVDPTFHADGRGEAFWDMVTLWILPVAGILLVVNNPLWIYFGILNGFLIVLIYIFVNGEMVFDFATKEVTFNEFKKSNSWNFSDLWGVYLLAYDGDYLIRIRTHRLRTLDVRP